MSTVKVFNPGRPSRPATSSLGSSGVYRPTLAAGHEASPLVRSRLVDMGIARPTKSRRVLLNNDGEAGGGMATANKPMKPIKKFKAKKLGKPRPVTESARLTPPSGGFKAPKPVSLGKTKSSSGSKKASSGKKASKAKSRRAANPKGATCPPKGATISKELMNEVLGKARKGQALGKAAKGKSGDVKKMLAFVSGGCEPAKGKKSSKKGKKSSKKAGSAVQRVARKGAAAAKRPSRRAKPARARKPAKASKPKKASKSKKTSKAKKKAAKKVAKKAVAKKPKKARGSSKKRSGAAIQPAKKKPAAKKRGKKPVAKKPAAKKRGGKKGSTKKSQTLLLSAAISQARGELMREINALKKRLVSGAKKTSRSSSKGKTALVSLKGGAKGGARAASARAKKAANPRRSDSVAVKTKKRKGAKGASKKAPKAKNPKKAKAKKGKAKKGKKRNQGAVAVTDFARNKPRKSKAKKGKAKKNRPWPEIAANKGKAKKSRKGKKNPTRNDVWSALNVSQGDHKGLVAALTKGFRSRDNLAKLEKANKAMASRVERALGKLEKMASAGYKRPDQPVVGPSQADIDQAILSALGLNGASAARRSARAGKKAAKKSSKKASKKASAKRNPAKASKKAKKKAGKKKATKAKGKKSKKSSKKKSTAKRSAKKGAAAAKKSSKRSSKKGGKKGKKSGKKRSQLGSALVKAQKSLTAEIRSLKAAVSKKRNPSRNQGAVAVTDFARNKGKKGKKKNRPWPEIAANKGKKKGKKRNQGAVAVTDFARNPSRNQGGIDGAVEVAFGRQPIQTLGDVGLALPGFVLGAAAPGFVGGFMPAAVKNIPFVGPAVGPLLGAVLGVGAAGAISHFGSQNDMISGLPLVGRAVGLTSRGAWFGAALGLARELVIAYTAPTSMVRKFVPGTSAAAMADAVGLSDDDDAMGQAENALTSEKRGGRGRQDMQVQPGSGFGVPMAQGADFSDEISVDEGAPPIGGAMTPDEMADFAAPAMDDFAAPAMGDFAAPAMNDFAAPAMGDQGVMDSDDAIGDQGVMDSDDAIADFAAPAMADFAAPA